MAPLRVLQTLAGKSYLPILLLATAGGCVSEASDATGQAQSLHPGGTLLSLGAPRAAALEETDKRTKALLAAQPTHLALRQLALQRFGGSPTDQVFLAQEQGQGIALGMTSRWGDEQLAVSLLRSDAPGVHYLVDGERLFVASDGALKDVSSDKPGPGVSKPSAVRALGGTLAPQAEKLASLSEQDCLGLSYVCKYGCKAAAKFVPANALVKFLGCAAVKSLCEVVTGCPALNLIDQTEIPTAGEAVCENEVTDNVCGPPPSTLLCAPDSPCTPKGPCFYTPWVHDVDCCEPFSCDESFKCQHVEGLPTGDGTCIPCTQADKAACNSVLCECGGTSSSVGGTGNGGTKPPQSCSPKVTQVSPLAATLGKSTAFTVSGSCLPSSLVAYIEYCADLVIEQRLATSAIFRCTPTGPAAERSGVIKTKPSAQGGKDLFTFNVQFKSPPSSGGSGGVGGGSGGGGVSGAAGSGAAGSGGTGGAGSGGQGGSICGNGVCNASETCLTCPADCGPCSGPCCEEHDGLGCSNPALTTCVCAQDPYCCNTKWDKDCIDKTLVPICGKSCPECGDGICGDKENGSTCPVDCKACTNECSVPGEALCQQASQPALCAVGGDGCLHLAALQSCGSGTTCVQGTCQPTSACGDGVCTPVENCANCPQDCCPTGCGDGVCQVGETCGNCPVDCPVPAVSCSVQGALGPCAVGAYQCEAGQLLCSQAVLPSQEVCDGQDNDCDGVVDDAPLADSTGSACSTGLLGVCGGGIVSCIGGGQFCTQTVQPSSEVCNGLDDDCDGVVDDGACAQCGDGVCAGQEDCKLCPSDCGPCVGTVLASGLNLPTSLAANAQDLFFATYNPNIDPYSGSIHQVSKVGGPVQQLAGGLWAPNGVSVTPSALYWSSGAGNGLLHTLPFGGSPTVLVSNASGMSSGYWAVGSTLYWCATSMKYEAINSIPLGGGPLSTIAYQTNPNDWPCTFSAVYGSAIYWVSNGGTTVRKVSLSGGPVTGLAEGAQINGGPAWSGMAVNDAHVYWADGNAGAIRRVPTNGGPTETLASGQLPQGLAIDASFVYWADGADPNVPGCVVKRASLQGGPVATLAVAPGGTSPGSLVVDAAYIYWTCGGFSPGSGMIVKAPK